MPEGSVLLIDEAGRVDSATLARLLAHADGAKAKLVLIGDPEQLGEIEAGGLFRAIAERSHPIYLDEVIRHRHEAEREGAKLIREGEGAEAIDLYRSEERVVVAKRNVEVERLNAMARQARRDAGELGTAEIEVGEARFAAGDLIITRVNDHAAQIYNRERWQVASVDAERQRVVLQGVDQARQVELDVSYLARTNPYNDAPALEHAYAVTTYSAQGTTIDRAFVMADPSMDKQEMYVAASRSREETYLYATPEIQADREEFAPRSLDVRDGLPHITEAAQRDRAQVAAHDVARLESMPTVRLVERRDDLRRMASQERLIQRDRGPLDRHIEWAREFLAGMDAQREWTKTLRRRDRRRELERIDRAEAGAERTPAKCEAEAREKPIEFRARAELEATERILAERRELAVTAACLAPPPYITKELGERPVDPDKRRSWEAGIRTIESYRQEHGVKDRDRSVKRSGRSHVVPCLYPPSRFGGWVRGPLRRASAISRAVTSPLACESRRASRVGQERTGWRRSALGAAA